MANIISCIVTVPHMNIYLIFCILYFFTRISIYLPIGVSPEELLIMAACILLFIRGKLYTVYIPKGLFFSVVLFLFLAVVSTLLDPYGLNLSLFKIITIYISRIILVVTLVNWNTKKDPVECMMLALKVLMLPVALLCCITLAQSGILGFREYVYSDENVWINFLRITVFFNPSIRSIDFVLFLIFSSFFYLKTGKRFWIGACVFWIVFIVLNGSRAGYVVLFILLLFMVYNLKLKNRVLFGVGLAIVFWSLYGVIFHFLDLKFAVVESELGDLRLNLFYSNMDLIPKTIWFGTGVESSNVLLAKSDRLIYIYYKIKGVHLPETGLAQHSELLRLLLENGVLGLLTACMVLLSYGTFVWRRYRQETRSEIRLLYQHVLLFVLCLMIFSFSQMLIGINIIYLVISIPLILNKMRYHDDRNQHCHNDH